MEEGADCDSGKITFLFSVYAVSPSVMPILLLAVQQVVKRFAVPPHPQTFLQTPLEEQGRGALALRADDLHVEVGQAAGHRQRQLHHALHRHRPSVQVVEQGPLLVVLGDKPELRPCPVIYRGEARLFRFMKKNKPGKASPPVLWPAQAHK